MKNLLKKFFEEQGFFVDFENHTEPDCKVKNSDRIIGEMNDLEKGLYSFISEKEKSYNELVTKIQEAHEAGNYVTVEKFMPEHKKNYHILELAQGILWTSINSRFEPSKETTTLGIREGFKVVENYEEKVPSGYGITIFDMIFPFYM